MDLDLIAHLAIALGLGLLVGFQREWSAKKVAGIRTFPLITVLGTVCAVLARDHGGWILATGLATVAAMLFLGDFARLRVSGGELGATTEIAALLMFAVGALLPSGYTSAAVVLGGMVAILLHLKVPLHELVERVGEADLWAIIRLVLIGLVILPLLPDVAYGPYEVINPFRIWLMVVLIVGISMAAYVGQKLLGPRTGALVAGFFGGIISSTATTVSYARRTRDDAALVAAAGTVLMLSSAIVFGRVLLEISFVAPGMLGELATPFLLMLAWTVLLTAIHYGLARRALSAPSAGEPPSEFKTAVLFGLLYTLVILGVAIAKEHLGSRGLYAVAAVSGLTDMDAITLSTAQLMNSQRLSPSTGWRLILVGGMANLVFKACAVAVLGHPRLLARIVLLFGGTLAGAAALLFLLP